MAGTKRGAPTSSEGPSKGAKASRTTRSSDAPKSTSKKPASTSKKPASKAAKAALSSKDFKAKALPLHVNLTHTPPTIKNDSEIAEDGTELKTSDVPVTGGDIGFIGNLTLVPSSFNTGSHGWKGSKRITVELQGGEVDGEGGQEKVQVQLTINATVLGSKPEKKTTKFKKAKDEEGEESAGDEDAEEDE
ncbi:hypothetical protein CPB83DRAFT_849361 [Crepidotus variabilis]|uniref:Uncharacterized protein n=1 Tax=Crepidotus variabilis TaxID=179855 RepID=A0A9P6JRR5_9AGAR|nr:hypothetical protein CPB83DRAFT_849361 [Crepidotus variabilis]